MRASFGSAAFKFGNLFRRKFIVKFTKFFANLFDDFVLLFRRQPADLLQNLCRAHAANLLRFATQSSRKSGSGSFRTPHSALRTPMIPREILKKIRQIEIRTNRLVSETLAGQYHSVFKGQGMNFDEVREYQPGDEVRSIDWNVTARMNHPFVKKFVEERELTLMLLVDVSGSGLFGSGEQSKRELAAEIASVLAFSAIRNNDKVGLILFTEEVEKFIPAAQGPQACPARHSRNSIFRAQTARHQSESRAWNFSRASRRIAPSPRWFPIFWDRTSPTATRAAATRRQSGMVLPQSLAQASFTALRQANRRHDVVAIQITDRFELELPALGRLVLKDAETGEVVEVNTGDARKRDAFVERQTKAQAELLRVFRSAKIDSIQLRTDQSYTSALGRFFETREKRRLHG